MKKIAVIGCGLRGDCYLYHLRKHLKQDLKLVAIADPRPLAREIFLKNYGNPDTETFSTGPELLEKWGRKLDGVIITSPNAYHEESLIPAFRLRIPVLLEKPVATTIEQLRRIWEEYIRSGNPPVIIGFVLRHTPFLARVREFIERGDIGEILTIESSENMGPPLVSLYLRGWRRKKEVAGPLILEKCSHDLDALILLAGSRVKRISSFASLTHFIPRKEASLHCRDCRYRDTCRYSDLNIASYFIESARKESISPLLQQPDLCVFNVDKDIPDHQVTIMEFENGILATFTIAMDHPYTTRYLHIKGTRGSIWGDLSRDYLRITRHPHPGKKSFSTQEIKVIHDGSGHHGGDRPLTEEFLRLMEGKESLKKAGLREGIEACLIALVAEESVMRNISLKLGRFYKEVFGKTLSSIQETSLSP